MITARRATLPLLAILATGAVLFASCSGGGGGGGTATIESLYPEEGTNAGGTAVTITGTGFKAPASVTFAGQPATDVVVVSETEITCVTPPFEMGGDAQAVAVEVRAAGRIARDALGWEYVNSVEVEPQTEKGINDSFSGYHRVPVGADFTGFIGVQDDTDVLHIHPPSDGRVLITVTWNASYTSAGLAGISLEFFHGPDPTPSEEAYRGGTITAASDFSQPGTPEIRDWLRMAYIADGHGPFLRIRGIGSGTHAGWDPVNPYTVHIEFEPDTTTEPQHADGFPYAVALTNGQMTVDADYDQDFDWYRFTLSNPGWMRAVLDAGALDSNASAAEVLLTAKLFRQDPADANLVAEHVGGTLTVGDLPGIWGGVLEANGLPAGTYFLRLHNVNYPGGPTTAFQHPVLAAFGEGDIEDGEPGTLAPAETENDANLLAFNVNTATATGYLFHDGDNDWFKVTAPGTQLTITWDHTNVRGAIGDYDPATNPFGGQFGVMVFDQAWFDTAGHQAVTGQALENDYALAQDTHSVVVATTLGEDYYILLDALRGYEPATSYTLTVTAP